MLKSLRRLTRRILHRKGSYPLLVVTHNAFRELDGPDVFEDFRRILAKKPDLVGVNEAANHVRTIRLVAEERGYRVLVSRGGSHAQRNDLLLVRRATLRVRNWGVRKMADETNGTPARYQLWAKLEHRATGVAVNAHVDHANSHIERKAWWRLARWHSGARGHFAKMGRQANLARLNEISLWLGDMNVNHRRRVVRAIAAFPAKVMRRGGAISSYDALGLPKVGTHGSRLIDYVFVKASVAVFGWVRQWVGEGYNTDHRPLFVLLEIRNRRR